MNNRDDFYGFLVHSIHDAVVLIQAFAQINKIVFGNDSTCERVGRYRLDESDDSLRKQISVLVRVTRDKCTGGIQVLNRAR